MSERVGPIFALDLATRSGFAWGAPGCKQPSSGSVRFASPGASHEAIFAAALTWATEQFRTHKPSLVVWEAPVPTSFKAGVTNAGTTTVLFGLPAIIGAVAFLVGIHDVRKAPTSDVRHHFIHCNPKRVVAKALTMRQCRALGWAPADDNEADALAIWHYAGSILDPKLAIQTSPLFRRAAE
ncbi:MAG TPA: hypothetical protein VGH62_11930 [Bradyrhizobium sp.]|jgi:hypothetical protein